MVGQDGNTPLTGACTEGHTDVAEALINNGADINHVNKVQEIEI